MTTKEPSSASSASRSGRPLPTFVALLTHPWVRSPPAASRGAPKWTACLDEDRLVPLRRWPRGWRPSKSVLEAPTVATRQPAPPDRGALAEGAHRRDSASDRRKYQPFEHSRRPSPVHGRGLGEVPRSNARTV